MNVQSAPLHRYNHFSNPVNGELAAPPQAVGQQSLHGGFPLQGGSPHAPPSASYDSRLPPVDVNNSKPIQYYPNSAMAQPPPPNPTGFHNISNQPLPHNHSVNSSALTGISNGPPQPAFKPVAQHHDKSVTPPPPHSMHPPSIYGNY